MEADPRMSRVSESTARLSSVRLDKWETAESVEMTDRISFSWVGTVQEPTDGSRRLSILF